ncbi:MAG: hypothetical protein ABUS47_04355 [Steroidobacter sp.]
MDSAKDDAYQFLKQVEKAIGINAPKGTAMEREIPRIMVLARQNNEASSRDSA